MLLDKRIGCVNNHSLRWPLLTPRSTHQASRRRRIPRQRFSSLADLRPAAATEPVPKSAAVTVTGAKPAAETGLEYTAPEVLESKAPDSRSDLFSFGAVLYEMITGKKAFEGKSRAVLIAAIATLDPEPVARFQPRVPRALEHVLDRCLAKDPDDRWQTAHDMMVQLRWTVEGAAPASLAGGIEGRSRLRRILLAASLLVIAALAVPAALFLRGEPAERFQFRVPLIGLNPAHFAISPDGRNIALVAQPGQEGSALYVRGAGSLAFHRLGGTEDATHPFWSPDSEYIGFVSKGRLRKVNVSGGAPQDLAAAESFAGGTWNAEGTILFGSGKGVQRVSGEGGRPSPVTTVTGKESGHLWPSFLPDGKHFVYLAWSAEAAARAVFAGALDSKDKSRLMSAESNAAYAAPGYLFFHRDSSLFAQRFDPDNRTLSGQPVHVADEVHSNTADGRGSFDVSQNGSVIYYQGAGAPGGRAEVANPAKFTWVERIGSAIADGGDQGAYGDMDVSPDGKLIAVTRQEAGAAGSDIWVLDWQRAAVSTRLTLDPADDINPVWSPDGNRVAFTSFRKGNADIYVKNANGSGAETPLLETPNDEFVEHWSRDGQFLAYLSGPATSQDIYILPLTGGRKPFPVVQGSFRKDEPQFSYDGKWLAYTSEESGVFQVYVMSLPAGEQKIQVSTGGGGQPRWRGDGKELFYMALDARVMAVDIRTAGRLESGVPRMLFPIRTNHPTARMPGRHMMSAMADGKRFLVRSSPGLAVGGQGGLGIPSAPFFSSGGGALAPTSSIQTRGGGLPVTSDGLTVIQNWAAGGRKEEK